MALREISATSVRLNKSAAEAGLEIKRQRQRRPSPDPRTQRLRRAHARAEAALLEVEAALEEFHRGDDKEQVSPVSSDRSPASEGEADSNAWQSFEGSLPAGKEQEAAPPQSSSDSKRSRQRQSEKQQSSPLSPVTPDFSEKLSEHTVANLNRGRNDRSMSRSKTPSAASAGVPATGKENAPLENRSGGSRNSDPPTPQLQCPLSTVKMRRYSTSTASSVSTESPAVRCPLSTVKMRRFSNSTASSVSTESPAVQWTSPAKTPLIGRDFGGDRERRAAMHESNGKRS